jgi:hypothetical protein
MLLAISFNRNQRGIACMPGDKRTFVEPSRRLDSRRSDALYQGLTLVRR